MPSELTRGDWERTLQVDLWGVIHGLLAFLPEMLAHGEEGHIVNTISVNGLKSNPYVVPYGVAKHAVFGLTELLYQEMEMKGGRIGVSALCPGAVNTNAWRSIYAVSSTRGDGPTDVGRALASGMEPDDVAALVESAIRTRRFYVFTHPEWLDQVFADHARRIMEQRNPAPIT